MGIVNRNGALWMATGVDNSGLYSGLNQAEGRIDQFGAHVGNIGNQIAKLTGIGFGIAGLKAFGSEIINVRGEMQMLESSFEVLLGGKGVSGFMAEMKQFAVDSPLSLTGVSNAAQTLLGFNIEAENVISVIKQIGDISMGNEQRFNSLILAFAQMSSTGKLMGQDLNQMINAGFNPLQEMSEKTGKSISKLKKEMESGSISSEMVASAFASATAEGGKFYGMTQKQAEGIKGLQAQLQGGLEDAFNEIGKSQDGLIAGGYKVATVLVENYETVGKVLVSLIATYGAYKAAVVLVTAAQKQKLIFDKLVTEFIALETALRKGATAAMIQEAAATRALNTMKQNLIATTRNLWAVMVPHPYIAVTVAVVALVSSLWVLRDATTAEEKALKRLNEETAKYNDEVENRKNKADSLIRLIKDETETEQAKLRALKELQTLYPSMFSNMDVESVKLTNEIALKKQRNEIEEVYTKEKYQQLIAEAKQRIAANKTSIGSAGMYARGQGIIAARNIKDDEELIKQYEDAIKELDKQTEEVTSKTSKSISEQTKEARDNIVKLKTELADLRSGRTSSDNYAEDIEKKTKSLKEAEDKLNILLYGKSPSDLVKGESAADKARKQAQDIIDQNERLLLLEKKQGVERQRAEQDLQNKVTQAGIDAMQDGSEKKARQREFENKLELQAIERQKEDYIEAYTQAQRELFNVQEELAVKKGEKKVKGVFNANSAKVNTSAFDNIISDTTLKQNKEQLETLLSVYQDFETRKKEINDKFDADLSSLESEYIKAQTEKDKANIDRAIVKLKKDWGEALSSINLEEFQDSIDWSTVFGNLDKVSTDEMVKLRAKLKQYLSSVGDSLFPQDLKTVTDAFEGLEQKIADKTPIQELKDSYVEYKEAIDEVVKAKEKLSKLEKGIAEHKEAAEELTDAEKKRRNALVKMSQSINSIGQKGTAIVNSMGELMGMFEKFGVEFPESIKEGLEGVGQMMSGLESLDLTKPMSVITSSVSIISGLGNTIAGLFGSSDQLTQATIDSYNRYMSTVDKLIAKQKELLESVSGTDAVVLANQTRDMLQRQIDATQKIANDWLSSKSGGKYSGGNWRGADKVISKYKKELQALGYDISSAQYDFITLSPEKLEDIRNALPKMWADLDADLSGWLDTIINLGDTMKEIAEKEKERLTGLSFDSLKNSFDDLLKSADTTFEDIGNSFEDHMRNAVLNFVKSKYLTDALKDWYDQFAKAYDDDELSQSEVDQLRKMYEEAYNKAQNLYDAALDAIGVDKENEAQREGAKGGFTNASQESVNEYLGVLYGVRQIQGDIRNINIDLRENSTKLNEMVLDMRAVVNDNNQILQDSLDYQSQIATNTYRTAEILDAIETYGLKLKQ